MPETSETAPECHQFILFNFLKTSQTDTDVTEIDQASLVTHCMDSSLSLLFLYIG